MTLKSRQSGEFLMARALLVVGILMALLIVPVWLKKEREDHELPVRKAEIARNQVRVASAVVPADGVKALAPSSVPRPMGHGLTFVVVNDDRIPPDLVHLSCHGQPAQLDQPHDGSCNPYQGDTSCRTVLPVLCIRPGDSPLPPGVDAGFHQGWTGGTLAATRPVMGAVLESVAQASGRCEAELGTGWRIAEFHDGHGGWGLQGLRGAGLVGYTRYWVQINDQKGNCWNSAG